MKGTVARTFQKKKVFDLINLSFTHKFLGFDFLFNFNNTAGFTFEYKSIHYNIKICLRNCIIKYKNSVQK